jgi:hypothetical protein
LIRAAALLFAAAVLAPAAGPLEFARAELDEAIRERKLNPARFVVRTEYSLVQPDEGFQIVATNLIRAGSQRGLVYGFAGGGTAGAEPGAAVGGVGEGERATARREADDGGRGLGAAAGVVAGPVRATGAAAV